MILSLLVAVARTSYAEMSFGGGAHSGLAFSKPDQYSLYGLGFGGGAHGDLNIIPALALRLNFDYHSFPLDKSALRVAGNIPNTIDIQGGNISSIGITVNALGKIQTGSSVKPYGLLGFGLQLMNTGDVRYSANGRSVDYTYDGTTNFGLNFGVGVEFAVGYRTKLFFDAKYVLIFASPATKGYIPLTFGVSF